MNHFRIVEVDRAPCKIRTIAKQQIELIFGLSGN